MRYLALLLLALPCWGQIQELVNAYPLRTTMLEWRTKINANFSYLDAKATGVTGYESAPTGVCSNYATGIVAAGTIYTCQNGTWGALTFSQVYPGAGVAVSSGSAWGSSLTLDTDGTLAANSDTRLASQKATKTYVDTGLGTKAGFPGSGVANSTGAAWGSSYSFSTSATLTENSDTYIASQKAIKSYVDTGLSGKAASNASTAVNGQTCALGGTCTLTFPGAISLTIDGGGSTITTGGKGCVRVPFAATVTGWHVYETSITPVSSSIVVDVWASSSYQPTVSNTLIGGGGTKPTLSSGTNAASANVNNWTTAIAAGDYVCFNVDSVTAAVRAVVDIDITR